MNGFMRLPLGSRKFFTVFGGPYALRPDGMFGVKMAAEVNMACDIDIPTKDFSVPDRGYLDWGLRDTVANILSGAPVYVGCMAGQGRTGLFLAILAKAFGIEHPVEYVREHYYSRAVENQEQYDFVSDYIIPASVKHAIKLAKWKHFFTFRKSLTRMSRYYEALTN